MSHWTKTKTRSNNWDYMKSALGKMDIKYTEGGNLRRAYGDSEGGRVDINIDGEIGLRQEEDGTISIVGDHYYSSKFKNAKKFHESLQKNYLVSEVEAKVDEQNFYISENENAEIGEDGKIRMWAEQLYVE